MSQKFAVSFDAMGKVSSWGPVIEQNEIGVRLVSQPSGEQECLFKGRVRLFNSEQEAGEIFSELFCRQIAYVEWFRLAAELSPDIGH